MSSKAINYLLSEPGIDVTADNIVGIVKTGMQVRVLGRSTVDGGRWIFVKTKAKPGDTAWNQRGWIRATFRKGGR